jgi:hypothetical protein
MDGANMTTSATLYCAISAVAFLGMAGGCAVRVKSDPIEVKPITLNVNVRIQRELDQFFAFEDKLLTGDTTTRPAATQPRSDVRG